VAEVEGEGGPGAEDGRPSEEGARGRAVVVGSGNGILLIILEMILG